MGNSIKAVWSRVRNEPGFFLFLLLTAEVLYMGWAVCTKWYHIDSYIHNNPYDTFMDYFHMLRTAGTDHASIYETKVIYPAFCFFLWSILYHLIPAAYWDLDAFALRSLQQALFVFVMLLVIMSVCIWELLKKGYGRSGAEKALFALSMILSGPMLSTIERGNIILLAFVSALFFILYYRSEKKYLRYLSYAALAVSASVKIYPALFGILILERRRWKEAALAVLLGLLVFVLPFWEFGGVSSIITLFQNIMEASPNLANRGTNYNYSFANLIKIIQIMSGSGMTAQSAALKLIPIGMTGFIYLTGREEWKKAAAIVLFFIWVPEFSYTYALLFFILPFLLFLKSKEKLKAGDISYMLLFLLIFLPTATAVFPQLDAPGAPYPISVSVMITNAGIVALGLLLTAEGIVNLIKGGGKKKRRRRKKKRKRSVKKRIKGKRRERKKKVEEEGGLQKHEDQGILEYDGKTVI